jgi:hypothetical protein
MVRRTAHWGNAAWPISLSPFPPSLHLSLSLPPSLSLSLPPLPPSPPFPQASSLPLPPFLFLWDRQGELMQHPAASAATAARAGAIPQPLSLSHPHNPARPAGRRKCIFWCRLYALRLRRPGSGSDGGMRRRLEHVNLGPPYADLPRRRHPCVTSASASASPRPGSWQLGGSERAVCCPVECSRLGPSPLRLARRRQFSLSPLSAASQYSPHRHSAPPASRRRSAPAAPRPTAPWRPRSEPATAALSRHRVCSDECGNAARTGEWERGRERYG